MTDCHILVPNFDPSTDIGEILFDIFSIMAGYENSGGDLILDFRDSKYLHPVFVALLAVYKDSLEKPTKEINTDLCSLKGKGGLLLRDPIHISHSESAEDILSAYIATGCFPLCLFERPYGEIDKLQTLIISILGDLLNSRTGWNPRMILSYILSELICNIQEHSHASRGYVCVFPSEEKDCVYVCVADNGISIHGSYEVSSCCDYISFIGNDHAEALRCSTKGYSTKDRPRHERGYGISSSLAMVADGLKGEFIILSGRGLFRRNKDGEQFVNLPYDLSWDGTFILVKVPIQPVDKFDFYQYVS